MVSTLTMLIKMAGKVTEKSDSESLEISKQNKPVDEPSMKPENDLSLGLALAAMLGGPDQDENTPMG